MSIDVLKSRIAKLLNLSRDNGATEGEAVAAMEKAMALMAAHQLSAADLQEAQAQTDQPVDRVYFYDKSRETWRRFVWAGAAELYMCRYSFTTGASDPAGRQWATRHNMIGEPANIEIASAMAMRFIEIGEALARGQAGNGRSFIDSFKKGYASRMSGRLRERKKEAQAQTIHNSTGSALVLADQYAKADRKIARYMADKGIKTKSSSVSVRSGSGFAAGRSAAEGVSLGGAAAGQSKQMRLIG